MARSDTRRSQLMYYTKLEIGYAKLLTNKSLTWYKQTRSLKKNLHFSNCEQHQLFMQASGKCFWN